MAAPLQGVVRGAESAREVMHANALDPCGGNELCFFRRDGPVAHGARERGIRRDQQRRPAGPATGGSSPGAWLMLTLTSCTQISRPARKAAQSRFAARPVAATGELRAASTNPRALRHRCTRCLPGTPREAARDTAKSRHQDADQADIQRWSPPRARRSIRRRRRPVRRTALPRSAAAAGAGRAGRPRRQPVSTALPSTVSGSGPATRSLKAASAALVARARRRTWQLLGGLEPPSSEGDESLTHAAWTWAAHVCTYAARPRDVRLDADFVRVRAVLLPRTSMRRLRAGPQRTMRHMDIFDGRAVAVTRTAAGLSAFYRNSGLVGCR